MSQQPLQQGLESARAIALDALHTVAAPEGGTGRPQALKACVEETMQQYFRQLDGQSVTNVYEMVLSEVEAPLLAVVMRVCQGNQCKAAEMMGLSRGTLRKKLQQHGML